LAGELRSHAGRGTGDQGGPKYRLGHGLPPACSVLERGPHFN
jgi:hypothetical protein